MKADSMNHAIGTSAGVATLGILAAILGLGGADRAVADSDPLSPQLLREGIHWPGEGGNRIEVSLGSYLIDFARGNLREESFEMAGYLDTAWTDPTIALEPADRQGKVRRYRPGQIWAPALEFVNAVEQVVA